MTLPSKSRQQTTNQRLLGIWRSDRRRTLAEWIWKPDATPEHRERVRAIFGHLEIRYTRQQMHTVFKGQRDCQPYEVIGCDSDSIALMCYVGWLEEKRIYHLHFEGENSYWLAIGRQREWFKRVKPLRKP